MKTGYFPELENGDIVDLEMVNTRGEWFKLEKLTTYRYDNEYYNRTEIKFVDESKLHQPTIKLEGNEEAFRNITVVYRRVNNQPSAVEAIREKLQEVFKLLEEIE